MDKDSISNNILNNLLNFTKKLAIESPLTGGAGTILNTSASLLEKFDNIFKKVASDFKGVEAQDFTLFGSIKYWDKIVGQIGEANQRLGIAGNLSQALKNNFQAAYPEVVEMGISAEIMAKSIEAFFQDIGTAVQLSKEQMVELAKMSEVLGTDSIKISQSYLNFGIGIQESTKRMRVFIKEADKLGVLPVKAAKMIADNVDKLEKYNFNKGTLALEKMALFASRMKSDMTNAFAITDKILEGGLESTIEMGANLQMLGGEFGKLGNPFELMMTARNNPEKFQEMIAEAASSYAQFNEQGELTYSAYGFDMLREAAKMTGVDFQKLANEGKNYKKSLLIKDELDANLRGMDDMVAKVANAAEKDPLKGWVVSINGTKKAIKNLTEEDIKGLESTTGISTEKSFENITRSNETLNNTLNRLIETLKASTISKVPYEGFKTTTTDFADTIKKELSTEGSSIQKIFKEITTLQEDAGKNLLDVLNPLLKFDLDGAIKAAEKNIIDAGNIIAKYGLKGIEIGYENLIEPSMRRMAGFFSFENFKKYWFGDNVSIEPEKMMPKSPDAFINPTGNMPPIGNDIGSIEGISDKDKLEIELRAKEASEKMLMEEKRLYGSLNIDNSKPLEMNHSGELKVTMVMPNGVEYKDKYSDEQLKKLMEWAVSGMLGNKGGAFAEPITLPYPG